MKKLTPLLMLLFSITAFAQIPTYYNDVNLTLSGLALKAELATKIINTHTNSLSYSNIWDASKVTDVNPLNSAEVLLIYGYEDGSDGDSSNDRERGINDTCGPGSCVGLWNREHVFANSLASPDLDDSGTSGPPYADAHNLRPCDSPTNSSRGNKLFASGSGNAGAVSGGWYPGDEWKGDVARIAMYMYLRYGSQCLPTFLGVGSSAATPDDMIDLFLQWNSEDPVSDFEKQRNTYHDSASNTYAQGNRNPFIDNPSFATDIWGGPQAEDLFDGSSDVTAPSIPTNLVSSNITGSSFSLSWTASTDDVAVTGYSILFNGLVVGSSATNSYNASGLSASTSYTVTIRAYDASGNNSSESSSLIVTTTASSGGATDLFLSEYIEGSSNNKALEIANFTGGTVDLSIYSIKRQTNGAGAWSSGLSLSGNLANESVYVIANSNANATILSAADLSTTNTSLSFNGNDPVGLFKNDVLIDIIGTFDGGGTNFAINETLQRKSSVTSPNTTYTVSEWNSLAQDTTSGLGSHTFDGGGTPDTENPTAPTSLTSSNVTNTTLDLSWSASTDNIGVTSYTIYSSGSIIGNTSTTSFSVTGLTADTSYAFTVRANDAAANQSSDSNTENVTTTGGSVSVSDLFISEYVEGSGNNKVLEIANFTGSSIDLSNYSIKRQTNGAGSWSSGLTLSGQLAHGNLYVIANSSASATVTNLANLTTGNAALTFNGNDPVGLFKNDVLIDIVGTFDGGSADFAANETLQRKSSVTSPNTTYTISEWNSLSQDAFLGLSFHSVDGIVNTFLGTTDNDWDTTTNWSFTKIPNAESVSIGAGITVNATGSISILDLTMESGSALTVASNISTSGAITLNSGASLIAKNSTTFNLTYNRYLDNSTWFLVSSVVTDETIQDIISNHSLVTGSNSNIGIGDYVNTTPGWTYATSASTGVLSSGEGRTIKLTAAANLTVSGAMPLTDISITITDGGGSGNGFNLIGNPFPSYITANHTAPSVSNNILSANSGILAEETIWFWSQADKKYVQVNQASALIDGIKYIAPGQGFFVRSNGVGGSFNFSETMQSHQSTDVFLRNSTTPSYSHIKLKLTNQSVDKTTDIIYTENVTSGWDNGFDATLFGGDNSSFSIFTHLVSDSEGQNLGIQSLSNSDFTSVIPIGVNAEAGSEITISAKIANIPDGLNIYLEDKVNDTFTLLDESSNYTLTLDNDINGIGRFYIHTTNGVLNINEQNIDHISAYISDKNNLRIVGIQNGDSKLTLYDILGKQLLTSSFIGNNVNDIMLPRLRPGIYIIQIDTLAGKLNKKIVIE
ncbi:MAG: endonuclease [Flavobacteriaceae bacterium]